MLPIRFNRLENGKAVGMLFAGVKGLNRRVAAE
jgi:hypothetical protein